MPAAPSRIHRIILHIFGPSKWDRVCGLSASVSFAIHFNFCLPFLLFPRWDLDISIIVWLKKSWCDSRQILTPTEKIRKWRMRRKRCAPLLRERLFSTNNQSLAHFIVLRVFHHRAERRASFHFSMSAFFIIPQSALQFFSHRFHEPSPTLAGKEEAEKRERPDRIDTRHEPKKCRYTLSPLIW